MTFVENGGFVTQAALCGVTAQAAKFTAKVNTKRKYGGRCNYRIVTKYKHQVIRGFGKYKW